MNQQDLDTVMTWLGSQRFGFAVSVSSQYAQWKAGRAKALSDRQIETAIRIYNEAAEKVAAPVKALVAEIEAVVTDPTPEVLAAIAAVEADVNAAIGGDVQASVRACAALKAILALATGVVPEADPREALVALVESNMSLIPSGRQHEFATSLCQQYRQRGSLSDRQWPYVQKFAAHVEAVLAEAERLRIEAEAATLVVQVRDRLVALTGSDTVTHSIRFCIASLPNDPTGEPLFFGLIGWGKSNTGCEKHVGAPGDVRRIALGVERTKALVEALMRLSDDAFLNAQAEYGKQMQTCGRCGAPLTDAASRAAGFGPDCASKAL